MLRWLCFWVLVPCSVQALDKAQLEAIESTVKRLGDESYEIREKASFALLLMAEDEPEVLAYLRRHAEHQNPEIRIRIGEVSKRVPEHALVTLKWIDPAKEKDMKSLDMSPDRIKLTVKNRSEIVIKTFWIDWEGKLQPHRTLKPGQDYTYAVTYREHIWLVADEEGKGLGLYSPGKKDARIVFRGTEGK